MSTATAGTIEDRNAEVQIVTGLSPNDINKTNSYIDLAPVKWTEGSGITQYMRGRIKLSDCELKYQDRTLTIKINYGSSYT